MIAINGITRATFMTVLSLRTGSCVLYAPMRKWLLLKSKREADELGVVLAVLGYGYCKVDGNRHLPQNRQHQSNAGADGDSECTDLEIRLNRADVGKDHAAKRVAGDGIAHLGRSG